MDVTSFRAEFPVLANATYLNAGTDGPIPQRGAQAAEAQLEEELRRGRAGTAHFERMKAGRDPVRTRVAGLLGCDAGEVALTRSATDGVNAALHALDLQPGAEVITTDEEHPGLL